MQVEPKIIFHNMDPSPAVEKRIEEKLEVLDKRFSGIISCQVVVDAAHRHQQKGVIYAVKIDVTLPDKEIIVSQHPGKSVPRHEDVYAAMNDSFSAIEKQLIKYKEKRNRDVKKHEPTLAKGVITKIDSEGGFGFIETAEKTQIYFHENAVQIGQFSELKPGSTVRYSSEDGKDHQGPHANVVHVVK